MAAIKQPADQSHFILPDLGEGVHEAEIISWKVKPGESVQEHQTIAEMETDKALVEVPSPWSGVIDELRGNEGEIVNVGSILVTYRVDGASSPAPESAPEAADCCMLDFMLSISAVARSLACARSALAACSSAIRVAFSFSSFLAFATSADDLSAAALLAFALVASELEP